MSLLQDYHNLRATTFNSKVQELDQRAVDLSESRSESSSFSYGGALAHPRAVVPEIRADC